MTETELWLLLAKLAISAGVVVSASLIIEKSGPLIGALIASLPLSSGPIYVFLAMEHEPEFLAATALGSLPSMIGIATFQLAYVRLAQTWSTFPALGGALVVWAIVAGLAQASAWPFMVLAPLAIASYLAGIPLVRRYLRWSGGAASVRRWWDVPFRALVVALVTLAALLVARLVGPRAAGLVALVPAVYVALILILQPRIGGPNTAAVVGTAFPGMIGLTLAVCTVHLGAIPLGGGGALASAMAVSMTWNLCILWLKRRR